MAANEIMDVGYLRFIRRTPLEWTQTGINPLYEVTVSASDGPLRIPFKHDSSIQFLALKGCFAFEVDAHELQLREGQLLCIPAHASYRFRSLERMNCTLHAQAVSLTVEESWSDVGNMIRSSSR